MARWLCAVADWSEGINPTERNTWAGNERDRNGRVICTKVFQVLINKTPLPVPDHLTSKEIKNIHHHRYPPHNACVDTILQVASRIWRVILSSDVNNKPWRDLHYRKQVFTVLLVTWVPCVGRVSWQGRSKVPFLVLPVLASPPSPTVRLKSKLRDCLLIYLSTYPLIHLRSYMLPWYH